MLKQLTLETEQSEPSMKKTFYLDKAKLKQIQ